MFKKTILLSLLAMTSNVYAANLPDVFVEGLSFNNIPMEQALTKAVASTGITVKVSPKVNYLVSAKNLSGYVVDVVEYIAKKSDVEYKFDGKVLSVDAKPKPLPVVVEEPQVKKVAEATPVAEVQPDIKTELKPTLKPEIKPEIKEVEKTKDIKPAPSLSVKQGQLAAYILKEYLDKSGYKLYWNASHEIEIPKDTQYFGGPEAVVDQFLKSSNLTGWVVDGELAIFVK
jgi:hypothetical protein